jgi:hypothetical protein
MNRRTTRYLGVIVILALLAWQRNWLLDEYALHAFTPSPAMAQIISQLELTPQGKAIMYRARPQIDSKAAFNKDCDPGGVDLELGCYSGGRIYILNITNASLASEMEVVSAHEMLHAAYARLGGSERAQVGGWVDEAAAQVNDPDLVVRLADYAKSEPGERANELHSILGTEYASLPTALGVYYRRYFRSRSVVTAAHAKYQAVFNSQKAHIDLELANIQTLQSQLASLNARMDALRASGEVESYNRLVPTQNALVAQVNGLISQYNNDVDEYSALSASLSSQPITRAQFSN